MCSLTGRGCALDFNSPKIHNQLTMKNFQYDSNGVIRQKKITVLEDLMNRLMQIGMTEEIAIGCIKHYISNTKDEDPIPMGNLVYEEFIQDLFYLNLKPYALEYVEENHPQAWFKPMLFDKERLDKFMETIKTN